MLSLSPAKILAVNLALLCATTLASAGTPATFLARLFERDVQVITVTDMTAEGRKLRRPSKEAPLYYEALVLGYRDYGRSIANMDVPDKRDMLKFIVKLLADQGYYPGTEKNMPEVLLAISWGMINDRPNVALQFMGGDKADVMWELQGLSISTAARALTRNLRSSTSDFIVQASRESLFMISIQAFDEELAKQGITRLLWHTKVSAPAQGLSMTPSFKKMFREAAPHLGRETNQPVWASVPERQEVIRFGEMRVLDSIDPDHLPITDTDDGPEAVGPEAKRRREMQKTE